MSSEALRLADAVANGWLENVDPDKADVEMIQVALRTQAARIAELEAELTEQARIVGIGAERELALIAERDQLRAEVERLRPNARRYEWLTEDHPKQETRVWVHQIAMTFNTRGRGHIDAAIDRAIEAAKEA